MHIFASADLELILHATESLEKVLDAINNNLININGFTTTRLTGYFGNEIILLRCILDAYNASVLAYKVFSSLSSEDLKHLYDNINLYMDKDTLYIRLSKQDIIKGRLRLSQKDPIRIRFKFVKKMHNSILEYLKCIRDEG